MKNIYTFITGLFLIFSLSISAQNRIYAPDLRSPENGESGISPDALLDWDAVTGITNDITYEVQIDYTEDFTNPVTFPRTNVTSMSMDELMFGTTYYWHVRAYDGDEVSDWSETWSFTVVSTVELKNPSDGATVYPDPTITWKEPITGLTAYQLQIDTTYLWSADNPGTSENLNGAFILSDNDKWIVGDGGFIAHYDGTSWNTVDAGVTANLNDIYFVDANNGWIVGDDSTVLHYDGTTFTVTGTGTGINKDFYAVSFVNENKGWIATESGYVLEYNAGSWTVDTMSQNQNVYSLFAVSENDVFAGAKKGYVFHYDGTSWDEIQFDTKKDVYDMWFTDANNGWAVCKSGKIYYYNGTEWTAQSSGITKDLYGVFFQGNTGFAVGKNGYMIRYTDGEWERVASGTSNYLNDIFFSGETGIVVGNNGTLLKKAGEGFSSPYAKKIMVNKDSTEIQVFDLLFGKTFYYRVRAIHSKDTSDWSAVKSMTTYSKPGLESPSNSANNQPLYITFQWQKFTGVIKYTIETSENEDFYQALTYFSDSNSRPIDNFGFGKTYYWRVNAVHSADVSDWSDVYSFTTTNSVVLTSPENGAEDINKSPRFEWEAIDGVNKYQMAVADNEEFTNAKYNVTNDAFYQCQSNLEYNTEYYWKVRGIVGLDTSGWSPVWHFVTQGHDGIDAVKGLNSVAVYPNPNEGLFQINLNTNGSHSYKLTITDMTGKKVYDNIIEAAAGKSEKSFNLDLRQGIYNVIISDGKNSVSKKLFIKK
jgi:photosystem II stability/assembly factor-like uncharacterized protein